MRLARDPSSMEVTSCVLFYTNPTTRQKGIPIAISKRENDKRKLATRVTFLILGMKLSIPGAI